MRSCGLCNIQPCFTDYRTVKLYFCLLYGIIYLKTSSEDRKQPVEIDKRSVQNEDC